MSLTFCSCCPKMKIHKFNYVDEKSIGEDGWIRLDKAKTVTINGLDGYAETKLIDRFKYARPKK